MDLVAMTPVNKNHASIAEDFLDKVKGLLRLQNEIQSYAVRKEWQGWNESLELAVGAKQKITIQLRTEE